MAAQLGKQDNFRLTNHNRQFQEVLVKDAAHNEAKEQVFSICAKLTKMVPAIPLQSSKADETIRYWLPEVPLGLISLYKKEYIEKNNGKARQAENS